MVSIYKSQYRRFKKALEWFDREDISLQEKEKFMPTFEKLVKELAELHQELRNQGAGEIKRIEEELDNED